MKNTDYIQQINRVKEEKGVDLELNYSGIGIIPIEIQELKWLKTLNLDRNKISEISNLSKLDELENLSLSGNEIREIEGLGNLVGLKSLDLSYNKIQEIKDLSNHTRLTELDLSHNQITEIKGLNKLIHLTKLNLSYTNIKKIKGLDKLTKLTELKLTGTKLVEIEGLNKLTNLSILDLAQSKIKELKGLNNLTKLTELDLSETKIDKIEGLEKLGNLTSLFLNRTAVSKIENISKLSQLTHLSFYNTKINKIEGLNELTKLIKLDFSHTEISEVRGLEKLVNLISLNLSNTSINEIKGLEELSKLEKLYLNNTEVCRIYRLDNLINLTTLILSGSKIDNIEGLDNLSKLEMLNLAGTNICEIKRLDKLINLTYLNLSQTKIEEIKGLEHLVKLDKLLLGNTKISEIKGLENLVSLTQLDLNNTRINEIQGLSKLIKLNDLNLSKTNILSCSKLEELPGLEKLSLENTKIKGFKSLGSLINLKGLSLAFCMINDLVGIEKLTNLVAISIRGTNIKNIESLGKLPNLSAIDLAKTKIKDLRPIKEHFKNKALHLFIGNDFDVIESINFISLSGISTTNFVISLIDCDELVAPSPEWIALGTEAINMYFSAIDSQGEVEMNEAKLMLVGRPHAGKTTLSEKLININSDLPEADESTEGVDVKDWEFNIDGKTYITHLWDFGGQALQYSIHQYFMTQRAIYILVDCTRDPEQVSGYNDNNRSEIYANYWLQAIKKLAKGSLTYYLLNQYKDFKPNISSFISLKRQYDFLKDIPFQIDLSTVNESNGRRFIEIREELQNAIKSLPNVGLLLPKKWALIRDELLVLAPDNPSISLIKYLDLCKKFGIENKESAMVLSKYLHQIGTIVHYSENESSPLYKMIILNRNWATKATYKVVLDNTINNQKNGCFNKCDLVRIWSEPYYKDMIGELLELLKEFEICYELIDSNPKTFLIPQCLTDSQPDDISQHLDDVIKLQFDFKYLPFGIVNRLAVKLHKEIDDNKIWKTGMVLGNDRARVVVQEVRDFSFGFIQLTISGDKMERYLLQQNVLKKLKELSKEFNIEDDTDLYVPCICKTCENSDEPFLHSYKLLIEMLSEEGEKITKTRCQRKPFQEVEIINLIDHAFFERPKEVKYNKLEMTEKLSIHLRDIYEGGNIINVPSRDNEIEITKDNNKTKSSTLKSFHKRRLIGWWGLAFCLGIALWVTPLDKSVAAFVLFLIGGIGTLHSMTQSSSYLRYSKWSAMSGIGIAGILNGIPGLFFTFEGGIESENKFIKFLGEIKIDEQPWVTISILIIFIGFAGYLIHKDKQ